MTKENNTYKYVYQYKDHLGNVRLSYANTGTTSTPQLEIIEESNYYPFGLKQKGYNNRTSSVGNDVAQKWRFGGKELDESLGLGTYDFGARNYNPEIGRWMNVDLMANLYYDNSPYNYVKNDPILYLDVGGNFRLSKADQKKYKVLTSFLKNDIHKLLDNKKILQSIMKFTGATEEQVDISE